MAESFNLNTFKQEYKTYNNRQYTAAEEAKKAMEAADVAKAESAMQQDGLLSLTISEKIKELGLGKRVAEQLGDTAVNIVKGVVGPLEDYLAKYENIFDQEAYTEQFQAFAKQMYFSKEALSKQASQGVYINGMKETDSAGNPSKTATKFIYDM